MVNPLLIRAVVTLAALGVVGVAAFRAAQSPGRDANDPRYRPRGGWGPLGGWGRSGGPFGSKFGDASNDFGGETTPPLNARAVVTRAQLAQLRDALSGAPLDPNAENFRCARCQSYYSVLSVRALANENSARCLSCRSIHRIPVHLADA